MISFFDKKNGTAISQAAFVALMAARTAAKKKAAKIVRFAKLAGHAAIQKTVPEAYAAAHECMLEVGSLAVIGARIEKRLNRKTVATKTALRLLAFRETLKVQYTKTWAVYTTAKEQLARAYIRKTLGVEFAA